MRGTGPAFICMNSRIIRYRLLDVVNFEANRVAYSVPQARSIGLLCVAAFTLVVLRGEARFDPERAATQISFASYEQKPLRALSGPAGVESQPFEWGADDESATVTTMTTERR
jgi:hypothetical protein